MADPSCPEWWTADGQHEGEDDSYQRFFDNSNGAAVATAMPGEQRLAEDALLDCGQTGMPLDSKDCYNGRVGELKEIEAKIAEITRNLRDHGVELVENMEGLDDDDDDPKKRFMTIADLPQSPLFGFPPSHSGERDARPEAVVDVGRRLKDGARLPAIRSPALLGVNTPIYIKDAVGPVLFMIAGVLVCVMYVLLRQNRLAKQLREAERALQEERDRSHRALLDALAYGRMGMAST